MALGKNLKRKKLLPDVESSAESQVVKKPVKSEVKKKSVTSAKPKPKKTSPAKPKTVAKKKTDSTTSVKEKTSAKSTEKRLKAQTIPKPVKSKKLTEKELAQRKERRVKYLEQLKELQQKVTNWIIFELGTELFAVDIAMTLRVIPTPEISAFPHTSSHIKGVAEVRRRPIVFIDLAEKYSLTNQVSEEEAYPYALIVKPTKDLVAILLQSVPQTLKIDGNQLIPVPETANLIPEKESFIKCMYRMDDRIVYMLDIEGLVLSDQGIHQVNQVTATH